MFNLNLNPDQEALIEEIQSLAGPLKKKAMDIDAVGDQIFDSSMVDMLANHNLLAPLVPSEFGGRGLDFITMAIFMEELGAICMGMSASVSATNQAASLIILAGNTEQKNRYLPHLSEKKAYQGAFALSESGAGSDISMIRTRIHAEENDMFSINGTKDYVINGPVADFIICLGAPEESRVRSTMVSMIVPSDTPGLEVGCIRQKMGLRAAATSQLHFHNVMLPASNIIGDPGIGYLLVAQTFDRGRALAAANAVGLARAAFSIALAYAREREQFGKPLFEHQAIAFDLARMEVEIEAARLLVWKACWLIDNDGDYTKASSIAKLYASTMAQKVVLKCADIIGARAYFKGHPLEKFCRDARALSVVEGTNNVQQLIIASQL